MLYVKIILIIIYTLRPKYTETCKVTINLSLLLLNEEYTVFLEDIITVYITGK